MDIQDLILRLHAEKVDLKERAKEHDKRALIYWGSGDQQMSDWCEGKSAGLCAAAQQIEKIIGSYNKL